MFNKWSNTFEINKIELVLHVKRKVISKNRPRKRKYVHTFVSTSHISIHSVIYSFINDLHNTKWNSYKF